jgi:hypothetical protein
VEVFIILGGSGGVLGLLGVAVIVGRGIFKQVAATEENTVAVRELSKGMEAVVTRLNKHEVDLAVLKDRVNHA